MSEPVVQDTTEPDDLNVGLIATIAIVGALLVMAIAAALTALVRSESAEYGFSVGAYSDLGGVARLKAAQRAKLEAPPAWVDQASGKVSLPIEHAMALVTADIQKDPALATVVPAGTPAATASAAAPAPEAPPAENADATKAAPKDDKQPKGKAEGKLHGTTPKAPAAPSPSKN